MQDRPTNNRKPTARELVAAGDIPKDWPPTLLGPREWKSRLLGARTLELTWESEAANWLAWTRMPGHDAYWWYRDAFFELLPPAGGEDDRRRQQYDRKLHVNSPFLLDKM